MTKKEIDDYNAPHFTQILGESRFEEYTTVIRYADDINV